MSHSIKTTVQNGTTFYRVISGSFVSEAEANKQLQALTGAGMKASIKKVTDL
ncbi:MAG: SPOR domain-containing protein [Saprospiraceae bacterium]|nr:SPOR domain-containing protein [Candidatus Opimibacter skivensis]